MPTIKQEIELAESEFHKEQKKVQVENLDTIEFNKLLSRLKEIRLKSPSEKPVSRAKAVSDYYKTSIETKRNHLVKLIKELRSIDPQFTVTKLDIKDGDFDRLMDLF
jgi:LytS/YehU family sensor histidine kinase